MIMFLPSCLTVLILSIVGSAQSSSGSTVDQPELQPLINQANTFLTTGKFNDAIRAYSEALEQAPSDYILYYKRATAYYSLSRHQHALADFDSVLDLTSSNFDKALLMKGRIYAKEGAWPAARDALMRYSARVKGDAAAGDLLFEVSEGEVAGKKAAQSQKAGLHQVCVEAATEALKVATHSTELRELRAECALDSGDVEQTVGDLIRLTHLTSPSTSLFLKIAQFSYFLLPPSSQAQTTLKQCLHFDPDSKPCAALHRKLKKFDKAFAKLNALRETGDWRGVVAHLFGTSSKESALGNAFASQFETELVQVEVPASVSSIKRSERRKDVVRALCQAYVKIDLPKRAEWWCDELLRFEGNGDDVDGLVGRGEAALAKEQWEEAVRVLEKAFEASGRSNQDVVQRLQKAQRLLKQSRKKDYYKVLGVARDADERTIKKAYRRAAKSAHPDKGGSEDKMAAVNEAYEVLSNPELRTRFDNGDDPNDPSAQAGGHAQQQGAHPFMQYFQGGSGGGFQFQQGGSNGGPFQFHFSGAGHH
ncbi:TPR-like protein [Phellopilus nigrolimitatus]|nr:TPR-like protein [Phellopilus nigrolimitatus]